LSVNASEERLAALSRRTFLSLWAYQNPYYDRGKELCDVLIVFGDDVIVMSDKVIGYNSDALPDVAWGRWQKRAIAESVSQLRGALKTIKAQPNAIYLDAKASSPFPLQFPKNARFHLVAVAHGCEEACQLVRGTPSLAIDSRPGQPDEPFKVGTVFGDLFVHVFNLTALDALFECFDTTVDFVHYLEEKEKLFSEGNGRWVNGEEDLIALYMHTRRPDGRGGFAIAAALGSSNDPAASVGEWKRLQASDAFVGRRKRMATSYLVDQVIQQLASDFHSGAFVGEQSLQLAQHAEAFRTLASEPRMARVLIGDPVADVLTEDPRTFWSVAVESPEHPDVLYVWLIYPQVPSEVPDEVLERVVGRELAKYVFVAMAKFPTMSRFFGIALPNMQSRRMSRMFRFTKRNVWNEAMQQEAEELSRREGIFEHIESTTRSVTKAY
jgi:hypothetical protein